MNNLKHLLSTALFFLLCYIQTTAQIKIEGFVRDARSGEPLQFVVVTLDDSRAGDVSNERGYFEVMVEKLPATLSFRLIGYEKTIIQVTKDKRLNVSMAETVMEMNTVEIRASQLEKVAGDEKRSIWDYTWCNGQLLICDYGTSLKSASLFLLDKNLDTLDAIDVPAKPVELFSDCMGNAHFKGTDSTWQILNENGRLSFLPAESNYLIDSILRKCKSANDEFLFFEIPQGEQQFKETNAESFSFKSNNDEIYYYYGPRNGSKLKFLTKISDEVSKKLKEAELTRDSLMHSKKHGESYSSAMSSKYFFYTTMVKEVYAPIVTIHDTTYIMDYVHTHWVMFDEAMNVASVDTIGFDFSPANPHRCLVEENRAGLYVYDQENGIVRLFRVNTENCALSQNWTIPHTFPEKITVMGNFVYYIHRDPKNRMNRFLSRLQL